MASYAYTPTTFNAVLLSTFARSAYFKIDNGPLQTAPMDAIEATIPGLGSRDVRGQPKGTTWRLVINLLDVTEATKLAFFTCLSEEAGLQTLLATDGDTIVWRISARVIGIETINPLQYEVVLRVADPRWQWDTAVTVSKLNQQASPFTMNLPNTGNANRKARPVFTITADAAKTGVADDFGVQLQGFIVNRSPNEIVNKPVYLFDQSGVQARIDMSAIGLASGDDLRVWLDDVPDIPRWLVNPHAVGADVVINVSLPAASTYTLTAAMTAIVPANGGSFMVNEDISRLPAKGFVVVQDEVIYFNSRAGQTLLGIQRAQWGTTAAIHAINASMWANPRHYVVASKFSNILTSSYGAPSAPTASRPAIQLPGSSNQGWKWGDQADDASTIYFDRTTPDRTAQWVPGFDADGNTVSPVMALSASGTIVTFKDDVPGDGNPSYNNLEIAIPQGIRKLLAAAIQNDWTPSAEILNLELFTRDAGGVLKLQDQLQQSGAAAARNLPAALAATAYGLKLKGRYNIAAGLQADDTYVGANIDNASDGGAATVITGYVGLQFTLERDTNIKALMCRLKLAGAGSINGAWAVHKDSSGAPDFSNAGLVLTAGSQTFTVTSTAASFFTFALQKGQLFRAGTYWLVLRRTQFTIVLHVLARAKGFQYGNLLRYGGSSWIQSGDDAAWLYAVCDYDNSANAPINSDQPTTKADGTARTGTTASFDKTAISMETTQYVYVHRTGTFAASMFHANGTIANPVTGDSIILDKWMALTSTMAIDCDQRTVTYTEAGVSYPVTKACTFSNTADWLPLSPGVVNACTYTDVSLAAPGQLDVVTQFRGVKV